MDYDPGSSEAEIPSKILSSSVDPDVIWIISSLCAWSWLALVKPKGTSFEAAEKRKLEDHKRPGEGVTVKRENNLPASTILSTLASLIPLICRRSFLGV